MPLRPLPYQQASTYRNELVPLTDDEKLGHLRAVHKCIDVGPAESLLETQSKRAGTGSAYASREARANAEVNVTGLG